MDSADADGRGRTRTDADIFLFFCNMAHMVKLLLGRPQPQMYPPLALNQYTLVNRTHKHYIYICFKAPQTS